PVSTTTRPVTVTADVEVNRLWEKVKYSIIFLIISFSYPIFATEGNTIKLNYSGSFRVRSFLLGRDVLLNRQTPTEPIYDKELEQQQRSEAVQQLFTDEISQRILGNPSLITPNKEELQFHDSRVLLNVNFITSKYFDALWGFQVGNLLFGGRGLSATDRDSPYIVGGGSGGEIRQTSAVNLQTNFLYINAKIPQKSFTARVGLQLFTSVKGRVLFARGTGFRMTKDFNAYNLGIELGGIRGRDRLFYDGDNNGFNDTSPVSLNIYYWKVKLNLVPNIRHELYSYYSQDSDNTDAQQETGILFWHGWFNEFNFRKYSFVLHGVLNHGRVRSSNPLRDSSGNIIFRKTDRHAIKGGLFDASFTYFFPRKRTLSFIVIGTTGRPGYEADGVESSYRGNGYRHLYPDFGISNVAIDWAGGYALFSANRMNGLYEVGSYFNFLLFNRIEATVGLYQLRSMLSPHIENNREFNLDNYKKTSTYFGDEANLNLRWNVFSDFQLIFRSAHFVARDGLKTLNDTLYGKFINEAFLTAQLQF
ncbi:MAG: hypothetical protein AAF518_13380, partial [Spirochaetota bacterium]